MSAEPKKAEITVMQESQGVKVGEYTIKAWTLRQLIEIAPLLEEIVRTLQAKGVSFEELLKSLPTAGAKSKQPSAAGWQEGIAIFQGLLPHLPQLLSISLNVPAAEVEGLEAGESIILGIRVIAANVENLTRFFGQMVAEIQEVRKAIPSTP